MPALARRVSIGRYIDHGESVEQNDAWKDYLTAAAGKRRSVAPGDTLPFSGVGFTFVTSNGEVLDHALTNTVSNTHCQVDSSDIDDSQFTGENPRSVGYVLSMGNFEFLNLGDLTVNIQHKLACPANKIGVIDLYQVPHHGNGVSPELSWALAPTVAVLNNGGQKGGDAMGYEVISTVPGIEAIWQVHRALKNDDQHNTSEQMTANLTEENDEGHWIKAIVQADGSNYIIENGRNGYSESYVTK
jgi:beta-lactamase superfamily II metal-dependent hydrolase